jgi:hypothetical protein
MMISPNYSHPLIDNLVVEEFIFFRWPSIARLRSCEGFRDEEAIYIDMFSRLTG